ncbi:MAG: hypothetical protein LBU65_07165 [Planctomycetaceae bacterium]|jgi:hypothetical protein|nr:hypothetical protein [Planctomycetaceae bacterium]
MTTSKYFLIIISFADVFVFSLPLRGFALDFPCLWGGKNEETTYAAPYMPVMGSGVANTDAPHPGVNRNAPRDSIAVQNTPYGTIQVPQNYPANQQPANALVGTVNNPATTPFANSSGASQTLYVIPGHAEADPLRPNSRMAVASEVVPAGTPGAIPVSVRNQNVLQPESEWKWTFARTTNTHLRRIEVVNPRTGRVVRTYYEQEEVRSLLPWLHQKEIVHYNQVIVPVATPVRNNAANRYPVQRNYSQTNYVGSSAEATTRVE